MDHAGEAAAPGARVLVRSRGSLVPLLLGRSAFAGVCGALASIGAGHGVDPATSAWVGVLFAALAGSTLVALVRPPQLALDEDGGTLTTQWGRRYRVIWAGSPPFVVRRAGLGLQFIPFTRRPEQAEARNSSWVDDRRLVAGYGGLTASELVDLLNRYVRAGNPT